MLWNLKSSVTVLKFFAPQHHQFLHLLHGIQDVELVVRGWIIFIYNQAQHHCPQQRLFHLIILQQAVLVIYNSHYLLQQQHSRVILFLIQVILMKFLQLQEGAVQQLQQYIIHSLAHLLCQLLAPKIR